MNLQIINNLIKISYLQSLFILASFFLFSFITKVFLIKVFRRVMKKTKAELDDLIIRKIQTPILLIIIFLGVKQALTPFQLKTKVPEQLIDTILIFIFIASVISLLGKMVDLWGIKYAEKTKSSLDNQLIPVIKKSLNFGIYIFGIIYSMRIWKIEIAPLVASLGIAGIAVGFALKETLENLFGGISMLLDRSFKVGDKIQLESGEIGEIIDIGLRSTKLRTYDNEMIYIPNGILANTRIRNYSQPDEKIRVNVNFSVEYGTEINKVENTILSVIAGMEDILDEPSPQVLFLEMGDFSLNFIARFWVKDYRIASQKQLEATKLIYNALNAEGIGIPFPTRTIYYKNSETKSKK